MRLFTLATLLFLMLAAPALVWAQNIPSVWDSYLKEASERLMRQDFSGAIEVTEKALVYAEENFEEKDERILQAMAFLGNIYYSKNEYPAADLCYRKLLSKAKDVYSSDRLKILPYMEKFAKRSVYVGNYNQAIDTYQEELRLATELGGMSKQWEAIMLWRMGGIKMEMGAYNEAIDLTGKALMIYENERLRESGAYAACLVQAGWIFNIIKNDKDAKGATGSAYKLASKLFEESKDQSAAMHTFSKVVAFLMANGELEVAGKILQFQYSYFTGKKIESDKMTLEILLGMVGFFKVNDNIEELDQLKKYIIDVLAKVKVSIKLQEMFENALRVVPFLRNTDNPVIARKFAEEYLLILDELDAVSVFSIKLKFQEEIFLTYLAEKNFIEAEDWLKKMTDLCEKSGGDTRSSLASVLKNEGLLYLERGEFDRAESALSKAVFLAEESWGVAHGYVYLLTKEIGNHYEGKERYVAAEEMFSLRLKRLREVAGLEQDNVAIRQSLAKLCENYVSQKKFKKAENTLEELITLKEKVVQEGDELEIANLIKNLAFIQRYQEKYGMAEENIRKSLSIKEKLLNENHPSIVEDLSTLGMILTERDKNKEAEVLFRKILEIQKKSTESNNEKIVNSLLSLNKVLTAQGKYDEAEKSISQAKEVAKEFFEDDSDLYLNVLRRTIDFYDHIFKYDDQAKNADELIFISKKKYGESSSELAYAMVNLASSQLERGLLKECLANLVAAEEIVLKNLLDEDSGFISYTLQIMGQLYVQIGDLPKAKFFYDHNIEVQKKQRGDDNRIGVPWALFISCPVEDDLSGRETAIRLQQQSIQQLKEIEHEPTWRQMFALRSQATFALERGDFAMATKLVEEIELFCKKVEANSGYRFWKVYKIALAQMLMKKGDFAAAELILQEAQAFAKKWKCENVSYTSSLLVGLGKCRQNQGDAAAAERLLQEALAECEKVFGLDFHIITPALDALAECYLAQGKLEQAEPLISRSQEILRKTFGKENPDYAWSLYLQGELLAKQGKTADAEERARAALKILEKKREANDLRAANIRCLLAEILLAQGKVQEAEALAERAAEANATLLPTHPSLLRTQAVLERIRAEQNR